MRKGMPETGIARCRCGGVEIEATFPSRFVAHCYCRSCRTTHASGVVTWIGFKRHPGPYVKGEEALRVLARTAPQVLGARRDALRLRIDPRELEGRGPPAARALRHAGGPGAL